MLIRSQNKEVLTDITGLMFSVNDCTVVACGSNNPADWSMILGTYSTKAKTIKVLDKICEFADSKHYERVVPDKCGYIGGAVFQMPQDSEV